IIFFYDKCCVCPRDIEIYLSAVFLCLAAALPHHNIPTDNDNNNKSHILVNTREGTENNEDYSINIFKNRVQIDTNTARNNNKRKMIDELRNNNNIYIISSPVFKRFKSLTVLI